MRRWKILLLITLVIIAVVGFATNQLFESEVYDVEYRVTGSASRVDVTYQNEGGGTSQESNVSVPWSYSFKAYPGDFVYISAQNQGESGDVTVTTYKDGSVFKTSTSRGAYVIATASGIL